jgi:hypothetical protein
MKELQNVTELRPGNPDSHSHTGYIIWISKYKLIGLGTDISY